MKIYADTSVLGAWFHPADHFAQAVTCDAAQADLASLAKIPQVHMSQ
jgi:hypothetical protein